MGGRHFRFLPRTGDSHSKLNHPSSEFAAAMSRGEDEDEDDGKDDGFSIEGGGGEVMLGSAVGTENPFDGSSSSANVSAAASSSATSTIVWGMSCSVLSGVLMISVVC